MLTCGNQYTATNLIQNFGSLYIYIYIYISDMHTDCDTPREYLTN